MNVSLSTVLGFLGKFLIIAGVLILLFAGFQLWGTGLAESRAQNSLEDEFLQKLEQAQQRNQLKQAETQQETDQKPEQEPGELPELSGNVLEAEDLPAPGEAFGTLEIESIGVNKTFVEGVTRDVLRSAPGHYPSTPLPGQPGNAAIAGHRTTYGAPFYNMDKIQPGELIKVTTLQGEFFYEVEAHGAPGEERGHFIVSPDQTDVLEDKNDNRITLTGCHPKYSARQRIIVTAVLTTPPAPASERPPASATGEALASEELISTNHGDELGESLGWQPEEIKITSIWMIITAGVAFLAWLLGRTWKRKIVYLLASPLVIACLFVSFTHLDKLLPAV